VSTISINRPQDGTFFGVPFLYDVVTQEFLLPDGKRFDYDDRSEMERYIMKNLSAFEPVVMQAVKRKSEILAKNLEEKIKMDYAKEELEKLIEKDILKSLNEGYTTSSTTASTGTTPTTLTMDELKKAVERVKAIGPDPMQRENATRAAMNRQGVLDANKRIQLRWDKKFNKEVLSLVEKAIHRGMVQYTIKRPMDIMPAQTATVATKTNVVTLTYDKYDKNGYMKLREQCEAAVRQGMEPPVLLHIPPDL
jgi:hypothetical protein